MLCNLTRLLPVFAIIVASPMARAADAPQAFTKEQVAFFTEKVDPLLKSQCLKCHGDDPKKLRGELDLRTRATAMKGGESGVVIVPGKPAESLLVQAVNHAKEGYAMPPSSAKMKPEQIAILTKWVQDGLAYPADRMGVVGPATTAKREFTPAEKAYWAYQPVKRPEVPAIADAKLETWAKTPIDRFLLTKMQVKGLAPSALADKVSLVRRAYYDLLGLPPTPEQIDAFVNNKNDDAWPKLIDELLASPQYGEKWGRAWLDVVRYAETNGYERDGPKPFAWRYRDYVIRSFNADKPYSTFVKEQIAGDEMPRSESADEVIATGFFRLGLWDDEPSDPKQALMDGYDDYVSITGQAILGMTLNCARCHDHKGDPIRQEDYYKLVAFFRDIRHYSNDRNVISSSNLTEITVRERKPEVEAELAARAKKIEDMTKQITAIEDAAIKKMDAPDQRASEGPDRPKVIKKVPALLDAKQKTEYAALVRDRDILRKKPIGPQEFALSINNSEAKPPQTFVNIRGNAHSQGPSVEPGFPDIIGSAPPVIPAPKPGTKSSGRRTILANWLTSKDNPMTARVMMNRVWQQHFGKGLVPTANDFGKFGEPVTHPELLDWLATEFMAGDWKLKRMHKLIMTSAAYTQSSKAEANAMKVDPANTLLWRFNMRRLAAEEVRDSILQVSGKLNLTQYGPSVYPYIPREVLAGQSVPGSGWSYNAAKPEEGNRRSVYVHVKRSLQVPILITHDQADSDNTCPVRYTTTVPTQALGMLNGEFTNTQAVALAARLKKEAGDDPAKQIAFGIRLTSGRTPTNDEIAKDVAFMKQLQAKYKLTDEKALAQYALLLLNTNEFVYLD